MDNLSFQDGSQFNSQGVAKNDQARTAVANLTGNSNAKQYTGYVAPQAIPVDSITPQKPINLPPVTPTPDNSNAVVAGAAQSSKSIDDYIKLLTPQNSENQTQYKTFQSQVTDLLGQNINRGTEQLSAEQNAGIPLLKTQLADLNGQIRTKSAEYNQAFNTLDSNPQQLASVVGSKQQQLQRNSSADIGLLTARTQALQGNLSAAQENVNRAIDLKYQTIQDTIAAKLQQLNFAKDSLNKEEQTRAKATELFLNQQAKDLEEKKALQKENLSLALTAGVNTKFVNKNGTFFSTQDGTAYSSPAEFFKAAGVTSFQDAYQKGLVSDLSNSKLQDINFAQQAQAKYNDVRIPVNSTPDQVRQLIQQSNVYKKDTYIAPVKGSGGVGVGGGVGGASPALLAMIDAGKIDPNKINSRTLPIFESIARAGVDAVQSHAGVAGKTKAYTDTYVIKTNATRLIGTIDKNLPLVASLADKVNTSGVPGLDNYLNGVKAYTGNNPDVGKFVNSLTTLRQEYANMLAKGATVTESDKAHALEAIPGGKSGAFYSALGDQLKLEGQNIISASDEALSGIFNNPTPQASQPQQVNLNGKILNLQPDGTYQ